MQEFWNGVSEIITSRFAYALYGFVFAIFLLTKCVHAEPCYSSLQSARIVHPTEHISWTDREGTRRYYAGYPRQGVKCDAIRHAAIPAPRQRRDFELEAALRQPKVDPIKAAWLAYEFLPRPVIDSSWDMMFVRRAGMVASIGR